MWLEADDPAAHYRRPGSLLLLARGGDEPVGIAGLHVRGDVAEVVRMYVRPQHRRRGIAIALLDALRQEATWRGARRLCLETEPVGMAAAVRLYQRYGFCVVGRHETDQIEFLDLALRLGQDGD